MSFVNIPQVKMGLVAVSRDCFPMSLSDRRSKTVVDACRAIGLDVFRSDIIIESEKDVAPALAQLEEAGVNALVVYLGNFGPESSETIIAQKFGGPVMFIAAAEEDGKDLINGRGDAFCGMLNASYNIALRGIRAYIPEYPVCDAEDCAAEIRKFVPVARTILGLSDLKIFTFGPRPQDFMACNGPIQPLFDLGVEIQENSELDLLVAFKKHEGDPRIDSIVKEMAEETGSNPYSGILPKLAQFEITLEDWAKDNLGSRKYAAFANKCWPAFQTEFGFVPCYVNSRLSAKGMPVSCEVDIYGALSEYIGTCITEDAVTLLDMNNTVPKDMYKEQIEGKTGYSLTDVFMGFHCGNTPSCKLCGNKHMSYQLIMKRSLEPDGEPNITRGTLEGNIVPGDITLYRLQGDARGILRAYVAEGEILDMDCCSFGGIGVIAVKEMGRFYRHVLVEKHYPHHGAVAFGHVGKAFFDILRYYGVQDIGYNQPAGLPYPSENPFH